MLCTWSKKNVIQRNHLSDYNGSCSGYPERRKGDKNMAKKANSPAHTKWMCKYHIVFTPKYRRKVIDNQYRRDLGEILSVGTEVKESSRSIFKEGWEYDKLCM